MSKLSYRTLAGERPQGKPNVYFSCHPEDFALYFEAWASRILKIRSCAVWYEAEPEAPCDREDLALSLSQMRLMVMPVTARLLTRPCRAMDMELSMAREMHIPVLPLMMEKGLDELFSKRFGDLQYLDPYDRDETRRDFDEVLASYIHSVLVSDELAERVRAAFDAYIFLSYRKKDRRKAQELMRLIHKEPMARDIAIWYDEFLTPGEDFNEAIGRMLEKSGLFALVVTPNLVNEPNYVMAIEYPEAVRHKKPILPVEMEETDREALEDSYASIPACVPGEEGEEFLRALGERLKALALMPRKDTPAHTFLIGLAYLDGIDVEVDPERGAALIMDAAEAGLPEAMDQLVTMYETGKGLERDYREGIRWRKACIEALSADFEKDPKRGKADLLLRRLCDLGDARQAVRDPEGAADSFDRMRRLAEGYRGAGTEWARRYLSLACDRLGDTARARGDLSGAGNWYEKGLAIHEELADAFGTQELFRDLSICCGKLGDTARERGDLAEARRYFERAHAIHEQLAAGTGTIRSRRDLGVSCERMGDTAREQGDLAGAGMYYRKSLAIRERLASETGTAESRRDLSLSYDRMGNMALENGDPDGARGWYGKALAISRELAAETGTAESRQDLGVFCDRMGDTARALGDLAGAKEWYEKGAAIHEQLAAETGTIAFRRDAAVSCERLGDTARALGDLRGAKEWYEKGLAIHEDLVSETGTADLLRGLEISCSRLGDIALDLRDLDGAQIWYEKALSVSRRLAAETGTMESRRDLSSGYLKLGDLAFERGDSGLAKTWFEKGLAIREQLFAESVTVRSRQDLWDCLVRLGNAARGQGDLARARGYYEKGLSIILDLARETGTVQSRRDLSVTCSALGDIAQAQGDLAGARTWYGNSLALREALAEETGTRKARRDLSIIHERLGDLALKGRDLAGARGCYEKSLPLREVLAEETGTPEARRDLSCSYERLAYMALSQGDMGSARIFYEKCYDIRDRLARETGTLQAFRDLALHCFNMGVFYMNYLRDRRKAEEMFRRVRDLGRGTADPQLADMGRRADMILARYF